MKETNKTSVLVQVAILFIIGVGVTGFIAFFAQMVVSDRDVRGSTENLAARVSEEVNASIRQYPSYQWLIQYWYDHAADLDVEYDAPMDADTRTAKKCALLLERHPDLQLEYADQKTIEKLPQEDQKLYAEIIYSWMTTRFDQIISSYQMNYLSCLVTDDTCKEQFFLVSGADPGGVRGTEYGQYYTLGVITPLEDNQAVRDAMLNARKNSHTLTINGDYGDYYSFVEKTGDLNVFVLFAYSISDLRVTSAKRAHRGMVFTMIYQIVLAIICLLLLFLVIIKPLKKVQENIRLYKETKDSEKVVRLLSEIKSSNEIKDLSVDVSELAEEIDEYMDRIKTITTEQERISTELNIATQIQKELLPSVFPPFPERKEFEIYASMNPAREVGGDFYDFFLIDDDHFCMVMADVSGKGVPAALFMVIAKTLIKTRALTGESPAQIMRSVNEQLCDGNSSAMFVTVWLAIVELSTGKGIAANAGHEHPVLRRAGEKFELVKYKHSMVLGSIPDLPFREHEFQMYPGDVLFVYTDGVPEATSADDTMFGTDRMLDALNEVIIPADETVTDDEGSVTEMESLLRKVKVRTDEFTGNAPQFDDLTMMAIKWKGPA